MKESKLLYKRTGNYVENLTGEKFGRLTVLEIDESVYTSKRIHWKVVCDCGKQKIVAGTHLKNGHTISCGCWRAEKTINTKLKKTKQKIIGKRFGKLVAIDVCRSTRGKKHHDGFCVQCKCDCGAECYRTLSSLERWSNTSCGCVIREFRIENARKVGNSNRRPDTAVRRLSHVYQKRASKKNQEFILTQDEFKILTKQKCYYCRSEPTSVLTVNGVRYVYNGVDRVDNTKGYTKDNCVSCCKCCNRAKSDMTLDEFKNWIKRIYHFTFLEKEKE